MCIRRQLVALVRDAPNKRHISRATGIDPATLTRIASGEREISGDIVDRLATYFGLELCRKLRPARRGKPS